MAWSHVTWAYTSAWSEAVAHWYGLAWFDRYLYGDLRRDPATGLPSRRGLTGTQRATMNYEAIPGHGVSKKFRSAWSLGGAACPDMVAGCSQRAAPAEEDEEDRPARLRLTTRAARPRAPRAPPRPRGPAPARRGGSRRSPSTRGCARRPASTVVRRAVADRVHDLAAGDALARADVQGRVARERRRRVGLGRPSAGSRRAASAGTSSPSASSARSAPRVAQVAEQDRAREAAVRADEQPAVAAAAGVEREHLLVARPRAVDAAAAEELDARDLQRRRGQPRRGRRRAAPASDAPSDAGLLAAAAPRARRRCRGARRTRRRRARPGALVRSSSSTRIPRPTSRPAVRARSTSGADAGGDDDEVGRRAPRRRRADGATGRRR